MSPYVHWDRSSKALPFPSLPFPLVTTSVGVMMAVNDDRKCCVYVERVNVSKPISGIWREKEGQSLPWWEGGLAI